MKKSLIAIAAVIIVGTSGLAIAQMNDKGKEMMGDKAGMMGGKGDMMGMMGKGMMGDKGMMEGKGMMMHSMMSTMMNKSMVASPDGGVIVMTANKLTKYDKDLNVVKEVDLKMDMDGMQKMMKDMMEKCPMMGKGMMETTSPEVDHASHH